MAKDKAKILLVDDDEPFRRLMANELSNRGLKTTPTKDSELVNQLLARQEFDLALVDLRLSFESGLDILKLIK